METREIVRTDENPADLGSRGCETARLPESWLTGPGWLSKPDEWPADIHNKPSKESETEAKPTKAEPLVTAVCATDDLGELLENQSFWKAVRIFSWIVRFICNCKSPKAERTYGPLTTAETEATGSVLGEKSDRSTK